MFKGLGIYLMLEEKLTNMNANPSREKVYCTRHMYDFLLIVVANCVQPVTHS